MNSKQALDLFSKKELAKVSSGEHKIAFDHGVQCITVPLEHYGKILDELNQRRKK